MSSNTQLQSGGQPGLGWALVGVIVFAAAARLLAYSGFFGSDEVTYTERAFLIASGDWTVDDYVGANRMGVNLPVAAFAAVLGQNEWAAAAWGMLCSLAEVALVTWAGWRMWGLRAGVLAGLLLASLPTHVHLAGRLLADPPLTLAITAAFVLFYEGERRRWPLGYLLAGVAAGLSFWVKPVTLFVFGIFLLYPLVARRIDWRWLWMAVGVALAIAANCLLFWGLTGRFWYIFEVMTARRSSGYLEAGVTAGEIANTWYLYLIYLFGKVYHTGLVGFLAAVGLLWLWFKPRSGLAPAAAADSATDSLNARFLSFWALGLLAILSFLPVTFSPLMWVPKQTNYMLIFVAPLCLLGGGWLSTLRTRWMHTLLAVSVGVGLGFALLLQGAVAVFTANSHATVAWAKANPQTPLYVMSNAYRAAQFEQLVTGVPLSRQVQALSDLDPASSAARDFHVVIDLETFDWDDNKPFARPSDVPACWRLQQTLVAQPAGLGAWMLQAAATLAAATPGIQTSGISARLQRMADPRPAQLYLAPSLAC